MSKADFRVESYKNELGQVIHPGDEVIFVATSWQNTQVRRGVYEGAYYMTPYYGKDQTPKLSALKVRYASTKTEWNDGAGYNYGSKDNKWAQVPCTKHARLDLKRVYRIETSLAEANGV